MKPSDWERLPDSLILDLRIRDLGLQIPGSPLEEPIRRLHSELEDRNIHFRPFCYLADEWFCLDRIPAIGIPFCLAHPRLTQIEKRMMYEVDGETPEDCMKLLRHECGHAFNYAYRLYRRTRWRELFGRFSKRYLNSYFVQPYSRRYVVHLRDNYAQSHPDEDFAETFAVWLMPDSRWESLYRDWPVIRKLRYVSHLVSQIGAQQQLVKVGETPSAAARMTSTLKAHYERKRRYMGEDFPGYYDDSLQTVFSGSPSASGIPAARFLRRHRRSIIDGITQWTGYRKYDAYQLVDKLIRRCDAMALHVPEPADRALINVTALVAAVLDRAFSGGNQRSNRR